MNDEMIEYIAAVLSIVEEGQTTITINKKHGVVKIRNTVTFGGYQ